MYKVIEVIEYKMDTCSVKTNGKICDFRVEFFLNKNRMVSVIAKKLRDNRNHQGKIDQTISINVDKVSIPITLQMAGCKNIQN